MSNKGFISVILATYNGEDQLQECVRSLTEGGSGGYEIIIADDGSQNPNTAIMIAELQRSSSVTIKHAVLKKDGFALSKSRNNAVRRSSGDILVFLDHDIIVPPGFIDLVRRTFADGWYLAGRRVKLDQGTTTDILSGLRKRSFVFSWRFAVYAFLHRLPGWRYLYPLRRRGPGGPSQHWGGMSGFCLITSREAFDAVDGFDQIFREYGAEDRDFLARLEHAGYRGGFLPRSGTVAHLWHAEKPPNLDSINYRYLRETIACRRVRAVEGFSSNAEELKVGGMGSIIMDDTSNAVG